jgi:two-component SAPR family response regulator
MIPVALMGHWRPIGSFGRRSHLSGFYMLFGKRKQVVKRILIVEDEPLTAFDNENFLGDAGYEIVATVDDLDEALKVLERDHVHLILSDVRLRGDRTGIELATAAKERGVPTLFATGHSYPGASEIAIGCVMKPYTERQLIKAIEAVDRHLQGEKVKAPKGVELFIAIGEAE